MSATGYTPIQLYRTTTAAATPSAGNLAAGELAINTTDEKLYFKNTAGVVKLLAASSGAEGTVTSVAASGGTTGLTFSGSPITTSGTLTLGGTLGVANGGTGASTFTSNGVLIGNGTSAISATAAGTTGQVLVGNTGGAPSWATLSGIGVTSFSAGTTGLTPNSATTGAITLAGTLNVANGGTGATSLTSGYLVKGNGTSAASASVVYDDGTNVGIGTSSPGAKLDVAGTGYFSDNVTLSRTNTAGSLSGMTITNAGTTAAYAGININSGTVTSQLFNDAAGNAVVAGTVLRTTSNHPLVFGTNATERMRIDASGNLLVGKTATSVGTDGVQLIAGGFSGFSAPGTTALFLNRNTNDGTILEFGRNGVSAATMGLSSSALTFGTAGSERMRIDNSGNVGIGTSSPGVKLDVVGAGVFRVDGSGTTTPLILRNNNTASVQAVKLGFDSSGAIKSSINAAVYGNDYMTFNVGSDTERMRIDSSGNLLVGTTTSIVAGANHFSRFDADLTAKFGIGISTTQTTATGYMINFVYNGSQVGSISSTSTTTTYNITSDRRLKHDIVDAPEASNLIDAIKVRSFKWNADNSEQRYGMVAQELLEVAPEAVSVPADEEQMMGVDYSKLVPMLIKEVQSLRARVAQLEGN